MLLRLVGSLAGLLASVALAAAQPSPEQPAGENPAEETGHAGPLDHPGDAPAEWTHEASAYPYFTWLRAEALLWWIKDGPAPPPLVTTGPAGAAQAAVIGQPGTVVLFGGSNLDYHQFTGGRWTVGFCSSSSPLFGLEVSGLLLENRSVLFGAASDPFGSPVLARPFINAQTGQPQVAYAAFPNNFAGAVTVNAHSQLWGLEGNLVHSSLYFGVPRQADEFPAGVWRLEMQAGVRYLELNEGITIDQFSTLLAGGQANFLNQTVLPPNALSLQDDFATRTQFIGGQLAARAEWVYGGLFIDVLGKVALGDTHEAIHVNGATTLAVPFAGIPATATGGLLATSSNIGRRSKDEFGFVPEGGVTLGYQCGPYLRFFAGYTFLYWNQVVRPGNQIDPTVNLTNVPIHPVPLPAGGPAQPVLPFRETDFWAQGITFGFEVRF